MAKSARATYAAATTAAATASGGRRSGAEEAGRSALGGVAQRFAGLVDRPAQNVDKTTVRGLFAARAAERHVWVVQSPAPRGPT